MYLTSNEHDKLRTLVMNIEIPLRTYAAKVICSHCISEHEFASELNALSLGMVSQQVKSKYGQIKNNTKHYYSLLENALISKNAQVVQEEMDVLDVGTLISLFQLFDNYFTDYIKCFVDYITFVKCLEKYHYVRNKLDHPGCKTLEREDVPLILSFISDSCIFISIDDEDCFWDKSAEGILKIVDAFTLSDEIISDITNNFSSIPFVENSLVCRKKEIDRLKTFIYGAPNALRKKGAIVIYGYGGVGKTAIATELIKCVVQDMMDDTTVNSYSADFILFFSAKEEKLDFARTSGEITSRSIPSAFSSCDELKSIIFNALEIKSFVNFKKIGFIVIDNLESLSSEERKNVSDFVENMSPTNVQYIITSRNEEEYDDRMLLNGFQDEESGIEFIDTYISENNLDVSLSYSDKVGLLHASKGNTLVLVLCLRRLSLNIISVESIQKDLTMNTTVNNLMQEFDSMPGNGYEIISEFMFKNTFDELEIIFREKIKMLHALLKVFAVYTEQDIDIFTICMIIEESYPVTMEYVNSLCRFLILEKKGDKYRLNSFAEKYIIQKLIPDMVTYENLYTQIERSIREIDDDRRNLDNVLKNDIDVKRIISDWAIEYEGDKIAAAKIYFMYSDVNANCQKSKFHANNSYEECQKSFKKLERTTLHPYIKYQKARILRLFDSSHYIDEDLKGVIDKAYSECIWAIKASPAYQRIRQTKTYASVLWIYAQFLGQTYEDMERKLSSIRYCEESRLVFERINDKTLEYYKCLSYLGNLYWQQYSELKNAAYLKKASDVSDLLYKERNRYYDDTILKGHATILRSNIKKTKENNVAKKN